MPAVTACDVGTAGPALNHGPTTGCVAREGGRGVESWGGGGLVPGYLAFLQRLRTVRTKRHRAEIFLGLKGSSRNWYCVCVCVCYLKGSGGSLTRN